MAPNELVRRIKQAPRPFGLFHFGLFHFGLFQCGLFAFAWGAIALPATAATIRYDLSGQLSELTVQGQPTDQVGSLKPGDRLFGSFSYDDAIDPVATYGLEPGQVLLTDLRWGNGTDFFAKATPTVPATFDLNTGEIIYPNPRSTAQFPNSILLAPLSANVNTATFSYFDRAIGAKGSFVATRIPPASVPETSPLGGLALVGGTALVTAWIQKRR